MITVNITGEYNYASDHLDQYDYGQILRLCGALPSPVEVQFSLQKTGGEAPRRLGTLVDGAIEVDIPDEMLRNNDTTQNYYIYAFAYIRNDTSGETTHRIVIPVKSRPKPGEYLPPDQPDFPEQLIASVMEEREKAETARTEAEAWAHGHDNYPEMDEDNAKFYAEQASESANDAQQAAAKNGYVMMRIEEDGNLYAYRTDNLTESLDFNINDNGELEVSMS